MRPKRDNYMNCWDYYTHRLAFCLTQKFVKTAKKMYFFQKQTFYLCSTKLCSVKVTTNTCTITTLAKGGVVV